MKKPSRHLTSIASVAFLLALLLAWRHHRQAVRPAAPVMPVAQAGEGVEMPSRRDAEASTQPRRDDVLRSASGVKPAPPSPFASFKTWAENYAGAPTPAAKQALLAEGEALAKARHDQMFNLIRKDPQAALGQALPFGLRKALPENIAPLVEETVGGRGQLSVLAAVPLPGGEGMVDPIQRFLTLRDKTYEAYVYGRRLQQASQSGLAFFGIALDGRMAVHSDPARVLDADEAHAKVASGVVKPEAVCPVSGDKTSIIGKQSLVDFGGEILAFCRGAHAVKVIQQLAASEKPLVLGDSGGGPNPTNPPPGTQVTFTQGRRTLLYIRIRFPDDPTEPLSESAAYGFMEQVNQFMVDGSYNTLSIAPTVTPVVMVPQPKAYYGGPAGAGGLRADALEAARAAGFYYRDYDLDIVALTSVPGFSWGGLAFVGARGVWLQSFGVGVTAHELGHNLGLFHANFWDTGFRPDPTVPRPPTPPTYPIDNDSQIGHDDINAPGEDVEYGDPWDTMGSGGGSQYNAVNKARLGWIPRQYISDVRGSVTNRLYAFDTPTLTAGRVYAMRVAKDDDRAYWASYRQLFPNNRWLASGVLLHWEPWAGTGGSSQLLDTTPGTIDPAAGGRDRTDAAVVVGRTFADKPANLYLTPIAKGGDDPERWIDVVVHMGPFPSNLPPTLTLSASQSTVTNGGTVTFTATAKDADGDALAYNWEFGDGTFGFNSPVVAKTYPINGNYVVRCEVSDMKGGVVSGFVVVTVGNATNFVMSGQVIDTFGMPVQGLRVHNGVQGPGYAVSVTDSQGNYAIGNQPPGNYTNNAFLYGYQTDPGFINPVGLFGSDAAFLDHFAHPIPRVSVTVSNDADEAGIDGTFVITRTGDTNQDLEVFYELRGTAVAGTHYQQPTNNSVIIPAGAYETNVIISPIDDFAALGPETVTLQLRLATNEMRVSTVLTNGTNFIQVTNIVTFPGYELLPSGGQSTWFQTYPLYVIAQEEATMNILEASFPPEIPTVGLFVTDDAAVETGADSAIVLVARFGSLASDLTVRYSVGGTASNGVDYLPLSGSITIPAGDVFATLPIVAIDDLQVEGNETVDLTILADPSYTVGNQSRKTVLIVDDDLPLVTVTATDGVATEQGNPGTFTVFRSGSVSDPLVVNYLILGTAEGGDDYDPLSGSVTIPIGQVSATVGVTPIADNGLEGVETVTIFISSRQTYNVGTPNSATVYIQDQAQPTVTLATTVATVSEGGGAGARGVLTLARTAPLSNSLVVNFLVGGTAIESIDYAAISTNIIIPAGSATNSILIAPINDNFREMAETVIVQLMPGSNYNLGGNTMGTVTITDDDSGKLPAVGFLLRNSSVTESIGVASVAVAISENPAGPQAPAIVEYHLTGGSATPDDDYSLMSTGYVVFPNIMGAYTAADLVQTIDIPINDDSLLEPNETIILTLYDPVFFVTNVVNNVTNIGPQPTNAALGTFRTHVLTIVDDDLTIVSIAATNQYAFEGGSIPSAFRITRTSPTNAPLTVLFEVSGTASPRTDYLPLGNSITIPAGSTSVLLPVIPVDDSVEEFAETVKVTLLSAPGSQIGTGSATIIIGDDDGTLQFSFANNYVVESNGIALVPVQRSGISNLAVSVDYLISDGTAIQGLDYTGTGGRLFFAPGEALKNISVPIINDILVEPNESIHLALTNVSGGVPMGGQSTATLWIVDDDSAFQFGAPSFRVNENGTNAVINVVRIGQTNFAGTVTLTTQDGTARSGADYVGTNVVLNFAKGVTNQTVLLRILDDTNFDGNETLRLVLSGQTPGVAIGTNSPATLLIVDDECSIEFAVPAYNVFEYAGAAAVNVRRNGGVINPVSVNFATRDGTALSTGNRARYTATSGVLQFAGDRFVLDTNGTGNLFFQAGESNKTILVPILDNTLGDADANFSVLLSNPAGPADALAGATRLGTNANTVVTIIDNEKPGHVDYEFRPGSGPNERVRTVALQPDLAVVFGGDFTTVDGISFNRICRLRPSGVIDTGFNPGVGVDSSVYAVASQADGKVLMGGAFASVDGTARTRLARLNADGRVDMSFGAGANNLVRAVAVQPNGQVVIGGDFTQVNGFTRNRIARLNPDGSLDVGFAPSASNSVYTLAVQSDGKILAGGVFTNISGTTRIGIVRLGTNGAVDLTFDPGPGAGGPVNAIGLQGEGNVIVGGAFAAFGGVPANNLARLLPDGEVDITFHPGAGPNSAVNALAVQANGKILIGGLFTFYDGMSRPRFARLKADGSLDLTFTPGSGADAQVLSVAVQPDTALIIGGDFSQINGLPRNKIARIHGDEKGSLTTVQFSTARFTVSEAAGTGQISVRRTGNTNTAFTIGYLTTDGTASNVLDYVGTTNQITFAAGETNKNFNIQIKNDSLVEGEETVNLFLTNAPPSLDMTGQTTAKLVILDDEKLVQFTGTNYFVDEGMTNAEITVARAGGLSGTISVTFTMSGGDATAGQDYTNVSSVLTFADNETVKTVLVPIVDDSVLELAETVGLSLSNPVGALLGTPDQATLTIVDNDLVYGTNNYVNTNLIRILDAQPADPYPSTINVSGLIGVISKVTITLSNLFHTYPSDIDVLLVKAGGPSVLVMSDAGGSARVTGMTLRLDESADAALPQNGPLTSGAYRPSDYPPADTFYSPAPAGPYATSLAVFNGGDPNGAWSLYIVDDSGNNAGVISNGWRLSVTTIDPARTNDLSLIMRGSTNPVMAGQVLSYVLLVTNNGPRLATGITLSDTLPAGLVPEFLKFSQGSCINSNGTILCDLGSLPVGGFATVSIIVAPVNVGSITNTATVTAKESDIAPLNNTVTLVTTVIPSTIADLVLTMTNKPNPVLAGQNLTYTLTVTNKGPLIATDAWLTNLLPDNIKLISVAMSQGSYASSGNQLLFNLGTISNRAAVTVTIVVQGTAPGLLTNSATVVADQPDLTPDNTASVVTTVNPGADVGVVQFDAIDPIAVNGDATYFIRVFNAGPGTAHGVTLFDTLPGQFTFVSATSSQGSNVNASGVVVFDLGTIPNGSNVSATVVARAQTPGTFSNSLAVVAVEGDPNLSNNSAFESTTVSAVGGGGGGSGIVVVPNTNANALAAAVTASGSAGITVTSASLIAHTLASGETSSGLYFIGSPPVTYNLTVPGIVLSSGDVSAYKTGTNTSPGFTGSYGTPATAAQQLLLDPITTSGTNHYRHFDATELDLRFDMQPGYDHVTFHVVFGSEEYSEFVGSPYIDGFGIYLNGSNIAYVAGSPVNINHRDMKPLLGTELDGVLAPNGNPILTFTAPIVPGSQNNTLTFIVCDTSDSVLDTTVYVSSLEGVLGAHADLALSMTAAPNPVVFGSNLTYQINVINRGPDPATNVVVSDALPPGLNWVGATASQGTCSFNTGVVTCALGNLPIGGSALINLLTTPATTEKITNLVSVTSGVADLAPANNVASNVVTVIELGSFPNLSPITLFDGSPAGPYPSIITISNVVGSITKITATLSDLTHSYPADLDILLVGPRGQNVLLMSDAGAGYDLNLVKLKFDDAAASHLPVNSQIVAGTYKPTNIGDGDTFMAPAPPGPYGSTLSVFNGTDPNGDWKLYIVDDQGIDSGMILTGWRLNLTTAILPQLRIELAGNQVVLSWPGTLSGFLLESRNSLRSTDSWNPVGGAPSLVSGRFTINVTRTSGGQFFRLRQ